LILCEEEGKKDKAEWNNPGTLVFILWYQLPVHTLIPISTEDVGLVGGVQAWGGPENGLHIHVAGERCWNRLS
jgi:hypothetical protein